MIERIITGDLGVNTYLYNFKDDQVLIIDPGSNYLEISSLITEKEYKPAAILLTHGHFDHIGAVKELSNSFNIEVYIHKKDSKYLGKGSLDVHKKMFSSMGPGMDAYLGNSFIECNSANILLEGDDDLDNFGLKSIHTPGHSPGSTCFYSEKDAVLFSGDTLFKGGLGRTDFPGGDYQTLINSLDKILKLPKNTVVYPGHGQTTTIQSEMNITQLY